MYHICYHVAVQKKKTYSRFDLQSIHREWVFIHLVL